MEDFVIWAVGGYGGYRFLTWGLGLWDRWWGGENGECGVGRMVEWSGEKGNAGCLSVCRRSVLVFREGWEL